MRARIGRLRRRKPDCPGDGCAGRMLCSQVLAYGMLCGDDEIASAAMVRWRRQIDEIKARFPHRCDERCACPVHGTPLIWWPAGKEHACQDRDCEYAHGLERAL
jgi:hypothetical protein